MILWYAWLLDYHATNNKTNGQYYEQLQIYKGIDVWSCDFHADIHIL